ncbi:MAG: cytochrome b/b6 domain-containing protein [bacterium]
MKRELVWDLPVRLFHALLATSFFAAFGIAQLVDDDSTLFTVHMLLGALMAIMVLLRLLWGLWGSKYARLTTFMFGPTAVVSYLKSVMNKPESHIGHNPGSSLAIWAIFGLALGMLTTGLLMSTNEIFEELHEVLAYSFLAVVVVHVAGVLWHVAKTKQNIILSMVDGKKEIAAHDAIPTMHPGVAVLFLTITAASAATLVNGFDAGTKTFTVPGLGSQIRVGEAEGGGEHQNNSGARDRDGDDDDD